MWGDSSGEQSLVIDELPEETMFMYSPDSLQAEIRYRQDRIRRDFQRPAWFQRKPRRQAPQPCAPELRARPAM
ncbi:hypothetical protein [Kribbella kalugense]|uniref:Uncharacterized protein n=1 Tax=Kribbella kalugense TaxID=2512221 RepID=A0A4R7ZHS2_9ACTN|nr:hypothetical protein [Kribbella kalugense]TDW17249.1 hypothetical protein EV650_3814 [Kribbella kalugense]